MKRYYGLTGFKLNVAIAVVAGTDFALFGYDQVKHALSLNLRNSCVLTTARVSWEVYSLYRRS